MEESAHLEQRNCALKSRWRWADMIRVRFDPSTPRKCFVNKFFKSGKYNKLPTKFDRFCIWKKTV